MKKNILLYTLLSGSAMTACFGISVNTNTFVNKIETEIIQAIELDEKIKLNKVTVNKLHTLIENENDLFIVQKNDNEGIYIYDSVSKTFLEKIPNANLNFDSKKIYYLGYLSYYTKQSENEYLNLIDNKTKISKEEALKVSLELEKNLSKIRIFYEDGKYKFKNKASSPNSNFGLYKKEGTNQYYIKDYEYAATTKFPTNTDGTCGYTASTILLYWWHKKIGGIIPDKFLDKDGTLKIYGYTLQDELLSIGKSLNIGNGVWAKPMQEILLKYAHKYISKKTTVSWYFFKTYLWGEIEKGRPALGHGYFSDNPKQVDDNSINYYSGNSKEGHVVLIYGYTDDYYICNYGWRGFEKVFLMSPIFGSVNFLKIDN